MASNEKLNRTQRLSFGGMMAALVFVATFFLKLPINPMTGGYIHLGDGFVLLGAALLGWTAVPAAAVGSMLADLMGGYTVYCLPTFVIKGAVAAVAVWGTRGHKPWWLSVCAFLLAEAVMVAGYFLVEWLFIVGNLETAVAAIVPNLVQGLSGVVLGAVLCPLMQRAFRGM